MTPANKPPVSLSVLDEKRFGIRTARAYNVINENFDTIMEFCNSENVGLLIARCATENMSVVQRMEANGFLLMDTLVYYGRELKNESLPVHEGTGVVRPFVRGEEITIRKVAEKAFKNYHGHYHSDPRLPIPLCDETYADWAYQSCVGGLADEVLVAEYQGIIRGFLTLRLTKDNEGEGVLFGVAPDAQGSGVGRSLMIGAMQWFYTKKARRMIISTQIINTSSQKVWARLGFEFIYGKYTFHKWFDGNLK